MIKMLDDEIAYCPDRLWSMWSNIKKEGVPWTVHRVHSVFSMISWHGCSRLYTMVVIGYVLCVPSSMYVSHLGIIWDLCKPVTSHKAEERFSIILHPHNWHSWCSHYSKMVTINMRVNHVVSVWQLWSQLWWWIMRTIISEIQHVAWN